MKRPVLYSGGDLKGDWLFTLKIDGVRMLRDDAGNPVSRAGKPLYNLQNIPSTIVDAEIFVNSWEETVSRVRTRKGSLVPSYCAYSLNPIDDRLVLFSVYSPSEKFIKEELKRALAMGYEGLVLYKGDKAYKVKNKESYDVKVIGSTEGKGKYTGLIGALLTERGKVSGMTDEQRASFTKKLPDIIEVDCMGLTPSGKFRHPRFIRERFDK